MASTGRVSQACARCRRQKLKCDTMRPCTLCVRARVECEPRRTSHRSTIDRPLAARRDRIVTQSSPAFHNQPDSPASGIHLPPLPQSRVTTEQQQQQQAAISPQYSNEQQHLHDGPSAAAHHSPTENQQFGANSSVIDFARNVFKHNDLVSPSINSTIPGDAGVFRQPGSRWALQSMLMPPASVTRLLLDAYFDRVHWFIFLFHPPTFMARAEALLSNTFWIRQDRPTVMTILMASAMALKCVLNDSLWKGHALLASCGLDAKSLLASLITEIRLHLLDLLDDSQVETVQVCLLLGTYYIYHGSPSLAWSILGMAVRTAYALSMHCESAPEDQHKIETQIRHRCWNHVTIGDAFSAMIYGRPAALDAAFSHLQPLSELDDTVVTLPGSIPSDSEAPFMTFSKLAFHILKYRLYAIMRQTLSTFRLLRLKDPLSPADQSALISAVSQIESLLADWRKDVPPYLSGDIWQDVNPEGPYPSELQSLSHLGQETAKIFLLQAIILQLTYDNVLIFIHRPLLEHKMAPPSEDISAASNEDLVSRSLNVAVEAALRISRMQMTLLDNTLALSFGFMHFFTAAVILCIPPARQPFSSTAQEAKAGIMRIILASRALGSSSQIAKHIDQLLTALLRITVLREMDNALHTQGGAQHSSAQRTISPSKDLRHSQQSEPPRDNHDPLSQMNTTILDAEPSVLTATSPIPEQADSNFAYDLNPFQDLGGVEFDTQLDEAFGSFGQVMFNFASDDPYTPWSWGARLR